MDTLTLEVSSPDIFAPSWNIFVDGKTIGQITPNDKGTGFVATIDAEYIDEYGDRYTGDTGRKVVDAMLAGGAFDDLQKLVWVGGWHKQVLSLSDGRVLEEY